MGIKEISTFDLVEELKSRGDVTFVINDRSSADYIVAVDCMPIRIGSGEAIIIMVKGVF